ncbi:MULTISPECIES: hypothetical protein [Amycolatopsis]|uniref:hypothetical protein n=1 Tax=Amycolatopsis sp. cg13 TaxID=3238807 RepID=UPI0035253A66
MSEETGVLRVLQLKGRPAERDIAAATGVRGEALRQILRSMTAGEWCVEEQGRFRLTPAGRDRLDRQLAVERERVDRSGIVAAYGRFVEHNAVVKRIFTDWQLIDDTTVNDHGDADYDAQVIERLAGLHEAARVDLAAIVGLAPRLAPYPHRLAHALAKVRGNERAWLTSPLVDSYHTIWFELHEELLGLTGLARADEALAGRAE